MDCRPPGSSTLGFSRQEYWSGLSRPSPDNLSDPGIEPVSPGGSHIAGRFFTAEPLGIMEKAVAPHSSTPAWKIPWTEEPGRLQSTGGKESDTTERLHFHFSLSCTREGNGNPLQCSSCQENPREGEPGGLPSMGSHIVRHD